MTASQIIVLATPVFLALIGLELAVGQLRGRNTYRLHDSLTSIGLGMLSQLSNLFTKFATIGIYIVVWKNFALLPLPATSYAVWIAAFILYDLCFYWNHRASHRVGLLWGAHVVHHQSEDYNLATALRQPATGWIIGWVFYLPLAVLGFPPLVFGLVALTNLLYQFWIHTRHIERLGWFDRWFSSPSNHRVHHAVNDRYLDRNYGGVFIVWDRLFGSFQPELAEEAPVYGTRAPLRSFNPLWANVEVYVGLVRDSWRARHWRDKLRVWLMPPGWRPADVAARFPKPPYDIRSFQQFDPPMSPPRRVLALLLFTALLLATSVVLWNASQLPLATLAAACGAVLVGHLCLALLCGNDRASGQPDVVAQTGN